MADTDNSSGPFEVVGRPDIDLSESMITPSHRYNNGYISLLIDQYEDLPEEIKFEGRVFYRKNNLHISLMAVKHLVPVINKSDQDIDGYDLVEDFLKYQARSELVRFDTTGEFRYVMREGRETIVAMAEVANLNGLFDYLRHKYDTDMPTQPAHITIYNAQREVGIGLLSQGEVERYSRAVELPELRLT